MTAEAGLRAAVEALADAWGRHPEPPDEDYEGTTEGHYAFGEYLATRAHARDLRAALAAAPPQPDQAVTATVEAVLAVREQLRRPPCWGPNEQGDYMVDMTVEAYEADLDQLTAAVVDALGTAGGESDG